MASEAILRIKVIADASQAAAGLDKAQASGGRFGSAMRKAALPAAAVGAAVLALGKKAVDAASDLQQANGAVEAVFGKGLAAAVDKNAKAAAKTMGLSAAQYKNYAALVGTSLQNAGFSASQAVEESNKVMQRGADLSALYGGTTADAVDAINAAVSRSEFDPLEKYGVALNMTKVNALLAAKGQDKLTGSALETAKKQAILAQIYKDTGKAAGQYAREADSVAGKQQTAAAQWQNAAAALGQVLLPVVATMIGYLSKFASWAQKNTTAVQVFAGVLLGLAAAVLAINAALKVYAATQLVVNAVMKAGQAAALGTRLGLAALAVQEKATAIATRLLNSAFLSSPITWIVLAVIALVAGFVLLYRRSETVRKAVDAMWAGIKAGGMAVVKFVTTTLPNAFSATVGFIRKHWATIVAILTGPVGIAVLLIVKNWDRIKSATRAVSRVIRTVFAAAWRAVSAAARLYWSAVSRVFGLLRAGVSAVARVIRTAFSGAWRAVVSTARAQIALVRTAVNTIKTAVSNVVAYIRDKLNPIWTTAKTKAKTALDLMVVPINAVKTAVNGVVSAVQSLVSWIKNIKWPKPPSFLSKLPGVGSVLGRSASAPAVAASGITGMSVAARSVAPGVRTARTGFGAAATTGGVNITVNGALDPEAVARQLNRILSGHTRRIGLNPT